MTRDYCDLCGVERTGKLTGSMLGISDGDQDGNGNITDKVETVCPSCYATVWKFIRGLKAKVKRHDVRRR